MNFFDIEPGIIFLVLWSILSWFSNKKKKNIDQKKNHKNNEDKIDTFSIFKKIWKEYSGEDGNLINKNASLLNVDKKVEEDRYENDFIDIDQTLKNVNDDIIGNGNISEIEDLKTEKILVKKDLFSKSSLRKIIIYNQILSKPRSIEPY